MGKMSTGNNQQSLLQHLGAQEGFLLEILLFPWLQWQHSRLSSCRSPTFSQLLCWLWFFSLISACWTSAGLCPEFMFLKARTSLWGSKLVYLTAYLTQLITVPGCLPRPCPSPKPAPLQSLRVCK